MPKGCSGSVPLCQNDAKQGDELELFLPLLVTFLVTSC